MHPIMTSHQVAELLQCKPETIDDMARNHKLPAVKLGGSWVFTADTLVPAINRMIESASVPDKPAAIKHPARKPPSLALLTQP